ncbi:MAG: response regulator [Lentisphaerae bacterium]|nr:response regulator [Lentisphaerota bacterium]
MPAQVRNLLFLSIAFLVGAIGIFSFGLMGGGTSLLIIFAILAAIGFGTRAGLIACGINLIVLICTAILFCTNIREFPFDIEKYASSPSAWGTMIINFLLLVPMTVIALRSVFHQLETALQETQESHQAQERLSNNLTDSFLYRYADQTRLEFSSSVKSILGYETDEFDRNFFSLLTHHPANKTAFSSDRFTASKRPPLEIQFYHKNRSKRWLSISETVVRTKEGIKYEGLAHDITQRKIRATALENILKTFADNSGRDFFDIIISQLADTLQCDMAFLGHYVDTDQTRVKTDSLYLDGKIAESMEYEIEGTPCELMKSKGAMVHPSNIRKDFPNAQMLQQQGIEGYAGIPITRKNGESSGVMVMLWKEPALDESLILPILRLFAEYIAIEIERRSEEEKLRQLEEQLRQSQKMDAIGQLAGGIAHDFNNMLMGIMGAADLLQNHLHDSPEAAEYYSTILSSCRRSAKLTRQLLTFARKQPVGTDSADVHKAIYNTISLLSNTIDRRISMKTNLMAHTHTVIGDSTQIQNALMNLCINAAQSMTNGGSIQISTRSIDSEKAIEIAVRDEGCGIPEDILNKIYEPFFTTKPQGKGTGLGLSAVLGIIQQHGGSINVKSKMGQGTTFTIELPTDSKPAPKPTVPEPIQKGSGQILLIEDEPAIRQISSKMLKKLGFEVTSAENGKVGLDIYSKNKTKFDLVVLDMEMPEMNGHDCFFAMKELNPDVRAILTSGYSSIDAVNTMLENGLCEVLDKPFTNSDLSQVIQRAFNDLNS